MECFVHYLLTSNCACVRSTTLDNFALDQTSLEKLQSSRLHSTRWPNALDISLNMHVERCIVKSRERLARALSDSRFNQLYNTAWFSCSQLLFPSISRTGSCYLDNSKIFRFEDSEFDRKFSVGYRKHVTRIMIPYPSKLCNQPIRTQHSCTTCAFEFILKKLIVQLQKLILICLRTLYSQSEGNPRLSLFRQFANLPKFICLSFIQ